ncbi:MAG: undecaprenyl-phosphate glucose phosphotransferase [Candidatus Aminicenantes bacterium]|nr:MAG: undecaprenyl-phosphate glucose phosphotransferase [Candidatus Aminicenantes bacterium]
MIKKRRKQLVNFYILSDFIAIILAFNVSFWLRFHSGLIAAPKGIPEYKRYLIAIPILILLQVVHFSYQGYYKIRLRRNRLDDLFLVLLNTVVTAFLILLIFSYFKSYQLVNFEISHIYLLVYIPFAVFFIFCQRLLFFKLFRVLYLKRNGVSKVLIAGTEDIARMTAENLKKYSHFGIEIIGFLDNEKKEGVVGDFDDLEKLVKEYDITDLVVALPSKEYETTLKLIETANNLLIEIRVVPDIVQITSLKAGMEHIEGIPIINLGDIPLQGWQLLFKRGFDIIVSLVGLILLLPFFLLIALLIKLTSKGPVFYMQTRVGLDGKYFKMVKFRTMIPNAEEKTGAIWSPPNDKRVTKVGRILRKLSFDELPQLINVLTGDMSLVGPRPERPELVDKFKQHIPNYMLRHSVKTGMTGWAQVHGLRGNTPLDKRIEFDIYYIQNWSFRLDLEILWRTILKFQFVDSSN